MNLKACRTFSCLGLTTYISLRFQRAILAIALLPAFAHVSSAAGLQLRKFEIWAEGYANKGTNTIGYYDVTSALVLQGVHSGGGLFGASWDAYQTPGGWDGAEVAAADPIDESVECSANAHMEMTVDNIGQTSIPLQFTFLINDASLYLRLTNFVYTDDEPTVEISSGFNLNDGDFPWTYKATVTHFSSETPPGLNEELLFDIQHIGKPVAHFTRGNGWIDVHWDPFVGTLDLGSLPPSSSLQLLYGISARVQTGLHNTNVIQFPGPPRMEGHAKIADPFGLSGFLLNGQSLLSLLPPRITIARVPPNQIELSWPTNTAGWRLQAQTNSPGHGISTNWFPVAGSELTNRVTLPATNSGSVFYRLSRD